MTRRVAIIGSGIAGRSAAWALKQDHDVTLYERHPVLGMDAFSINLASGSGTQRIDVPMRVVYEAYYPNVTRLYREAAIELEPLEYSGTLTRLNGPTYFSYRNLHVGPYAWPMLTGWRGMRFETGQILMDALRFFAIVARDLRSGAAKGADTPGIPEPTQVFRCLRRWVFAPRAGGHLHVHLRCSTRLSGGGGA